MKEENKQSVAEALAASQAAADMKTLQSHGINVNSRSSLATHLGGGKPIDSTMLHTIND